MCSACQKFRDITIEATLSACVLNPTSPLPQADIEKHIYLLGEPKSYARNKSRQITVKMGIKQLFSIIKEEAPDAIKEGEIKNQFGRKVAIVSQYLRFYLDITDKILRMRMSITPNLIGPKLTMSQIHEHLLLPDCGAIRWPTTHERER